MYLNLKVNTTLFEKYADPIKSEHLWVCTKSMHLHIPISLKESHKNSCRKSSSTNLYTHIVFAKIYTRYILHICCFSFSEL